jgi:hypothetical protein
MSAFRLIAVATGQVFVFGKLSTRIPAGIPVTLPRISRDFPHSLQTNECIIPRLGHDEMISKSSVISLYNYIYNFGTENFVQ